MRRPTAFSTVFASMRAAFAGAIVLAAAVSCDTYTTSTMQTPDGAIRVRVHPVGTRLTAAQKDSMAAAAAAADSVSFSSMVPVGPVSNIVGTPTSVSADVATCGSGAGAFVKYEKSKPDFLPEPTPNIVPYPVEDDMWIPDSDVPLGFTFNFYGQNYDKVNVSPNGFLLFGTIPAGDAGFPMTRTIGTPSVPNNMIALAWTDWQPNMVPDPIRWETRGTAPNRKFIIQWYNVPEYSSNTTAVGAVWSGAGRLTGQIVLSEGSNDITIYTNDVATNQAATPLERHVITQGIENADGTVANYDSIWNPLLNGYQRRVMIFLKLHNDAVRFSQVLAGDKQSPTITAPATDSADNDPGANFATVVVPPPTVTDNCGDANVTLVGIRSDDPSKPISAVYPVGITTITWTATDKAGNSSTVTQIIHVYDVEPPVWDIINTASVWTVNATSPLGAVVNFDNVPVHDNVGVTSRSCVPPSGNVFPIGDTTVVCTAWDAAGNSAADTIKVVIVNAHDQIGNLIDWVESRGFPDGTVEPLVNQLQAAFDMTAAGTSACKKMYDFMSMVQKKNSNISSGDAAYMLSEASRILSVLNCAPARNAEVLSQTIRGTVVRPTK
ncbi:MAG TPA: HYR domain-containing protein [Gemmatimonadaceae bacterium]|nr:HYR domain-containing protein [Gemmatimonadaceae bacterium]